jgi:hypothetical protein
MTPEEEAYEEALRRIREAEETGALELVLSDLETLVTSSGVGQPRLAPIARPLRLPEPSTLRLGLRARRGLSRCRGMRSLPGENLRDEPCGNAAPIAWPAPSLRA